MDFSGLMKEIYSISLLKSVFHVVVVIFLAWIALKMARKLSQGLVRFVARQKEDEEFQKRTRTLGEIVRYVIVLGVFTVATMTVLKELGIDIGPVLAAAGIAGLAIGFGAQSLVKDIISGFFILLEDQIRVGDVVNISDKGGLVEKVGLRTTVLRDLHGNVHYVPNGSIAVVTNMTKEYSRYVFDIGVAYREDIDDVIEVIKLIDEEMRSDLSFKDDILEPIEVLGLEQFANSSIIIRTRTMTLPGKQWRVGREFNRRIKKKFDELNIEIPFPHVTLYMGERKDGKSAPLRVVKEER